MVSFDQARLWSSHQQRLTLASAFVTLSLPIILRQSEVAGVGLSRGCWGGLMYILTAELRTEVLAPVWHGTTELCPQTLFYFLLDKALLHCPDWS